MRKFEYDGRLLTFKELLPFSVVPEKTLRNRLFSSSEPWDVEKALNTPFGQKGKPKEISANDVNSDLLKIRNKEKERLIKNSPRNYNVKSSEVFCCHNCRETKPNNLKGRRHNNSYTCIDCDDKANKALNRKKWQINQKVRNYKANAEKYKKGLSEKELYFVTCEKE